MARTEADRKRAKAKARDAYRKEFEERRAKRVSKTIKVQPFDPAKFIDQIRLQSWATIHTVVYAVVVTTACIFVGRAVGSQAGGAFLGLLAIGSTFYYLLRVWGLDLRELVRKTAVVGVFLTYFVTWLSVCFLIPNAPFIDDAPPEIHHLGAFVQNNTSAWIPATLTGLDPTNNSTVMLRFRVVDSSPVERVTFHYIAWNETVPTPSVTLSQGTDGFYAFTFEGVAPVDTHSYRFTIDAWDSHDQHGQFAASFSVLVA